MEDKNTINWNFAIDFVNEVYALTMFLPVGEAHTIIQRIRKTAISLSISLDTLYSEASSLLDPSQLYTFFSLLSILETYILLANKYIFSRDMKILTQKLNSFKEKIESIEYQV